MNISMTASLAIVKTRFAPSPTGLMTIGNYRTALFNFLYASKFDGKMLLRFEDTDRERSDSIFVEQICNDLLAMGMEFSPQETLFQSQRGSLYEKYYHQLLEQNDAYECFCTPEDLALERKLQLSAGVAPKYSGRCRDLTYQQRQELKDQGRKSVLRYRVPEQTVVSFNDILMGAKVFDSSTIGDFIIRKANGDAAFFFSNALDDVLSQITHVFRGDDHLTNTPRQILLLKSLNFTIPEYGHFPLILGSDHKPLSKRTGSRSIADLLKAGYLSNAINNFLSRLGHSIANNNLLELGELVKVFSLDKISSSSSHFDPCQLEFWQRKAFIEIPLKQRQEIISQHCPLVPENLHDEFWQIAHANCTNQDCLQQWSHYLFDSQQSFPLNEIIDFGWSKTMLEDLQQKWSIPWHDLLEHFKTHYDLKGKKLFMPLRLFLSCQHNGPPLEDLYRFVCPTLVKTRIGKLLDDFIAV